MVLFQRRRRKEQRQLMTNTNFAVGTQYFTYRRAAHELRDLLAKPRLSAGCPPGRT